MLASCMSLGKKSLVGTVLLNFIMESMPLPLVFNCHLGMHGNCGVPKELIDQINCRIPWSNM